MKKVFFHAAVLAGTMALADVTGVTFHQDSMTRHVRIDYTLDAPAIVTVDFLTNGVSIGAQNFRNAYGDVNRLVKTPAGRIEWQPAAPDGWPGYKITDGSFKAVVTAWATNAPPDYMAIDLNVKSNVLFYVSEDAMPAPVTNDMWKTDWLLMKRIHAANTIWRMGSAPSESGRTASSEQGHLVMLTQDYYMGVYMVTQKQWGHFGGANPSAPGTKTGDILPVNRVIFSSMRGSTYSWPADGHAVTADSAFGCLRAHSGINSFDLPTEAEWEYSCRAGTNTRSYDGTETTNSLPSLAWYVANSGGTGVMHPVGQKLPNAWGLYDMYGNTFEVCLDRWATEAYIEGLITVDPVGPDNDSVSCVSRGGSCDHAASYSRTASRNGVRLEGSSYYQGLRLKCAARVDL